MTDLFDNLIWAYRAVFKQTAGGGGNIFVRFTARERMVILYGNIGPNDYAADRTVRATLVDSADNQIGRLTVNSPFDNESFPIPRASESATLTPNLSNQFQNMVVLGKGDELLIIATALAQNEECTIALRALIRSWPPAVTTAGSGGTVTITETYNKVI